LIGAIISAISSARADDSLLSAIRSIDPQVVPDDRQPPLREMLWRDARDRLREANRRDLEAWRSVKTRADWERLRDERIAALKASLGVFPPVPERVAVQTAGAVEGADYRIERIAYESRPGLWVTANLYLPDVPPTSMPGLLICHSHHNPKTQGELQDMGITWARQGCAVLVPDQLGHGERRQHPFRSAADYPREFRVGRQDYYFRYHLGVQLQLAGESLIGWMAWDMMRGIDVLLARPGVDGDRIILLGSVAGGGDPAAVTAALDDRIDCLIAFNFGGPQPETAYPLPDDAETAFNYAGSGSWESTRNLRLSARDGFLPWVIVGSIAPRKLIYPHEFIWDQERDPVWKRLRTIYGWCEAPESIGSVHGFGNVRLSSNEASHCNHIGRSHREQIDPLLEQWFGIPTPKSYADERHDADELLFQQGERSELRQMPVHELLRRTALERLAARRAELSMLTLDNRRRRLRESWTDVLGDVEPYALRVIEQGLTTMKGMRVERLQLGGERDIVVPTLLLLPESDRPRAAVVGIAQGGKAAFLQHRAEAIAALLSRQVAVCLTDVRGTGETACDHDRGRTSAATGVSSTELMLGQTILGSQLKDLRSLLAYLRERSELDAARFAVWGDSFATMLAADAEYAVPQGSGDEPTPSEPCGPLLALLGGLYEDAPAAVVCARGGLVSLESLLETPCIGVPHDVLVPGALTVCEMSDLAAALAPRPLWIGPLVDGVNRAVPVAIAHEHLRPVEAAYRDAEVNRRLSIAPAGLDPASPAKWIAEALAAPTR
jgi:cephalosporin-C deacetylase-like acetyl esterase